MFIVQSQRMVCDNYWELECAIYHINIQPVVQYYLGY